MEAFYTSLALVSAGVSLAMSAVYLALALRKGDKSYLLFGLMGLSLVVFFLLPPTGFILHDVPPYPGHILFKRFFICAYYAITPWFILAYSGYPKRILAFVNLVITIVGYGVMAFTLSPAIRPIWSIFAVAGFGCILLLGMLAVQWQFEKEQKTSSRWLAAAMSIYGILFLLTAANQLSNGGLAAYWDMSVFFPMHLHSLFFMIIMGQRLVTSLLDGFRHEEAVQQKEVRWQSFMTHAPFIVIELDKQGRILYANDYGSKLLGYAGLGELRMVDWFNTFHTPNDRDHFRGLFEKVINGQVGADAIKVSIQNKNGDERIIAWSNFPIPNPGGDIESMISIGRDITESEKASQLVEVLKDELLMEQVNFSMKEVTTPTTHAIIGSSKALRYAIQKAQQVATTHAPVLLEGETGVGKELFANLIHENSSRVDRPFIKVNCGALPKELIEDELFGHEKGAFTSAIQSRKGRFELADGGTIFLDEIGELPIDMQPKLLRVLQNGEFERIGGQKTLKVDVRILAATNRDLGAMVQQGQFRADLYYRLNVFPITIPPLRNRKEDLPMLINYFIVRKCKKYEKQVTEISHANLQRMTDYNWPGNIRELKNVIERSVIVSDGKALRLDWWGDESPP